MWAFTHDKVAYLGKSAASPVPARGPLARPAISRIKPWHRLRLWLKREATRNELYHLDGQTLADLGITQGDFPAILDGTYRRGE
jgi:uncharacterized protein YjiS (DUF1127 family)